MARGVPTTSADRWATDPARVSVPPTAPATTQVPAPATTQVPAAHRADGSSRAALLTVGVIVLLVAALVVLVPVRTTGSVQELLGASQERLGAPPEVPTGQGSYAFLHTQQGGDDPVSWNPCRAIPLEVNPAGAPGNWRELVHTAMAHTSAATGFRFELLGTTDSREFRPSVEDPDDVPPVLIAWATDEEYPLLAGDIAGVGGGVAVERLPGRYQLATGTVVLDAEAFAEFAAHGARVAAQAIVDHEFAHLVGLAHVDDPGELMHEENVGRATYGPGDREGLARLGQAPCY